MAWSPPAHNAGIVWVSAPGDYATFNSNHTPDGTVGHDERLWLHLRDNRLTHCVFQTTGEIIDTCCDAWNWLLGQTGHIRSLCSYPWLERASN
jgi:hypothetical protein